ncbi:MAG: hypothetical protein AB2L11_11065 [Syntrophobacteraceae bacterium]
MKCMVELHEQITAEIIAEYNEKAAASIAVKRKQAQLGEQRMQAALAASEAAGLKISQLQAFDAELSKQKDDELKAISTKMQEMSLKPMGVSAGLDVEKAFLPEGALVLTPAWVASFSDDDAQDQLTSSSSISAQDLLSGGGCQDYWNWASGGGWGCLGSGVGSIQSWVYFGFWYRPSVNRFYSVVPLFRFRGYVIVRADDAWYNCKDARVIGSAWTNVYQYNWKGWNHVDVYNDGGDNINLNTRRDIDRWTYNSYLLGAGDWAWISCVIGLYARAQGGGSYGENNFSVGDANYLCVPYCYVY